MEEWPLLVHDDAPPAAAVSTRPSSLSESQVGGRRKVGKMKSKSDSFQRGWRAQLRCTKYFFHSELPRPYFSELAAFVASEGRG